MEIHFLHCAKLADHITYGLLSVSLPCKLTVFYFVLKRKGKKSILDVDPQAQALLEMAGKSRQSEGLREPIEEDEDDNDEN